MNQGSNEWSTTKGDQQNEQAHRNRRQRSRRGLRFQRHLGRSPLRAGKAADEHQGGNEAYRLRQGTLGGLVVLHQPSRMDALRAEEGRQEGDLLHLHEVRLTRRQ